jgi:hypothetical protein
MITATLWLLIAVNTGPMTPQLIERFPTVEQCDHVRKMVYELGSEFHGHPTMRCIQATVMVKQ